MAKKDWKFKEGFHEENVNKKMWDALLLIQEDKEEEAVSLLEGTIETTPQLLSKYIKKKDLSPLIDASRSTLCYYGIRLYIKASCIPCLSSFLNALAGTPECAVALKRALKDKGSKDIFNKLLKEDPEALLMAFQELSAKELQPFFEMLFKIAKNEIGEKQYLALMLLYKFISEKEVKDLFMVFAEDWDTRVRRISLNALLSIKDDEAVKKLAKRLIRDEEDALNVSILKRILS
ncbi:MAG: hypothetical protein D6797_08670 [Bdellovibrio sp.]|nr:MAG: hypothetical protein D6797_08670 [Bdellovibrio sp.]